MAKFELKNKVEVEGEKYSHHTIVVTFDNPDYQPERTEGDTHPELQFDDNGEAKIGEDGFPVYKDVEGGVTVPAVGDPTVTFEQDVILPDSGTDKAAQDYADDYEKQFNANHKGE
jgi:hypothetical protein